ncbi:centrosome and spindle pole-associated protein 1 isoform X2 [Sebastes fasciatus]|uniref:centrosome and spindle pole-associated protein 1 isoform X2 n=1 Tax=Sebastes fasciatus TaxID=394691 RepID=UPI003D9F0DCC
MPPASTAQRIFPNPDRDFGLSLLLGNDYERKKKKLQQELQQDYKHYAAKKKDVNTSEPHPQPQGLSLPIDEHISVQEKLRDERKKEYNLFLQEKAQIGRLKRGAPPVTSKSGQVQASDAVHISSPASHLHILNTHTNTHPPPRQRPASRRDAATLTETVDNGKSTVSWRPGRRGRRRWQIRRLKEPYNSEEVPITEKEDELEFRHRGQQDRHAPYKEERRTTELRDNRAPQDTKEVEAPGVHDQNNNEWVWKSDLQMPDSKRTAARSRPAASKDKAEFATGLMIGAAEEKTATQMRKERYKQDLLKQIDEQRSNKIREKKLELRVAATGAKDSEKQPDRIMQFGAVNQQYDSRRRDFPYKPGIDLKAKGRDPNPRPKDDKPTEDTPGKSHVDYSTALSQLTGKTAPESGTRTAQGVPPLDLNEDYHRDVSNMLGEVAKPRVAGVPPPVPPTVNNNYQTPYDAAYYYYGTRNPLDPNLPYNKNDLPGGVRQSGHFHSPLQRPPTPRPGGRTKATDQHQAPPLDFGELLADNSKQRRETALSYKEELRKQIKEREEHKRKAKEEKERYDAKIEAEMMAYSRWGRSGGGAPIIDQNGHLVSDLKRMHRTNEETFRNHVYRSSEQIQSFLMRKGYTPRGDPGPPLSHRLPGFNDQPSPRQIYKQDRYYEDLKRQIEEKKQKQTEEIERRKIEEAKEEKRLEEQRARIQQQYEEELERSRQRRTNHRLKKQDWIHKPKTQHQEEEKWVRQEAQTEKKVPESARDRGEKKAQRAPSPPISSLQRRLTNLVASRPSSVVSTRTERSVSAPHLRPPPLKIPQLQGFNDQPTSQQLHKQDRYKDNLKQQREPSTPIPALQRKQKNPVASRPSSVVSQPSARTDRSVSAPRSRPVTANIRLRQDGQQEVFTELATLRRYLRNEQRQLEVQLGQTDRQESPYPPPNRPRGRPRWDTVESTHKQAVQPSTGNHSSGAAHVNMQNIREFNQLKYRDTASREEVRHMYPDPPTDAQSLDIQQQALLRDQQRKIRLMKREEEQHDFLDQKPSHCRPRNKPAGFIHRDSVLPSETAFVDVYSDGGACEEQVLHRRRRQPSAERQETTAPRRRHDYDEVAVSMDQEDRNIQPDAQSVQSVTSLNLESKDGAHNQQRITRQDTSDHNARSEGLSGDEMDVLSLRSALERRVSMETVATEAWLRPGTSDTVKRAGCRERPKRKIDAPPWLSCSPNKGV